MDEFVRQPKSTHKEVAADHFCCSVVQFAATQTSCRQLTACNQCYMLCRVLVRACLKGPTHTSQKTGASLGSAVHGEVSAAAEYCSTPAWRA